MSTPPWRWRSAVVGCAAPAPLFTALLNYRHSASPLQTQAAAGVGRDHEVLMGEERTNYPLTLSVDDLGEAFV